jgi:hypothetical protein
MCIVCDGSLECSEVCAHQSDASEQLVFSQASKCVLIQTTTRDFSWKQMTGPTRHPETSANLIKQMLLCTKPEARDYSTEEISIVAT